MILSVFWVGVATGIVVGYTLFRWSPAAFLAVR